MTWCGFSCQTTKTAQRSESVSGTAVECSSETSWTAADSPPCCCFENCRRSTCIASQAFQRRRFGPLGWWSFSSENPSFGSSSAPPSLLWEGWVGTAAARSAFARRSSGTPGSVSPPEAVFFHPSFSGISTNVATGHVKSI